MGEERNIYKEIKKMKVTEVREYEDPINNEQLPWKDMHLPKMGTETTKTNVTKKWFH